MGMILTHLSFIFKIIKITQVINITQDKSFFNVNKNSGNEIQDYDIFNAYSTNTVITIT